MEEKNTAVKKVSPKDVFLHLLSIITLYFAAGSFVTMLFQYVNILLPDPLFGDGLYRCGAEDGLRCGVASSYSRGPLRFAVSSLIVVLPVYLAISWFLNRSYLREPARREVRLRKWLVYFTLFAAALIMIGDLVRLVYEFLGGELTLRFALKALSLLIVAGAIFWYYLADVRRGGPLTSMKAFIWSVAVLVGAGIVGAFILVGSPATERARRFDEERVNHLREIQGRIVEFWRGKERLPENLDALTDDIAGFRAPTDPETGIPYEYQSLGEMQFELCATFNMPSVPTPRPFSKSSYEPRGGTPLEDFWDHKDGYTCFARTIDPEFYPPFEKSVRPAPAR